MSSSRVSLTGGGRSLSPSDPHPDPESSPAAAKAIWGTGRVEPKKKRWIANAYQGIKTPGRTDDAADIRRAAAFFEQQVPGCEVSDRERFVAGIITIMDRLKSEGRLIEVVDGCYEPHLTDQPHRRPTSCNGAVPELPYNALGYEQLKVYLKSYLDYFGRGPDAALDSQHSAEPVGQRPFVMSDPFPGVSRVRTLAQDEGFEEGIHEERDGNSRLMLGETRLEDDSADARSLSGKMSSSDRVKNGRSICHSTDQPLRWPTQDGTQTLTSVTDEGRLGHSIQATNPGAEPEGDEIGHRSFLGVMAVPFLFLWYRLVGLFSSG